MYELVNELLSHVRAAWRYRWYGIGASWVIALAGWAAITQIPDRYEASARVYVDTQSVLRPLLAGVAVQPNVEQMVTMMSRTLISRPNVERVIRMADMDVQAKGAQERDEQVRRMTKELVIRSAGAENLYTISYVDRNPDQARRVVQSLLTIFVEGSLGNKRKDAESAQRFINEQLKTYNERLVAAENAMTDFKRRNMSVMGDGKQNYYARLAEAQGALSQATLDLKEAENSRDAIKKQMEGEEMPSLVADQPDEPQVPEINLRLQALQQKLDALRMTYTEKHPDILALARMIEQLTEQKRRETRERKPVAVKAQSVNLVAQQLGVSLAEAEAAVASMRARVGEYQRRFDTLKAAAHAIPQVEAEYTQLTRDYEVTKRNYDLLLGRLESAQISGSMESAGVMDFRVIDPPQVPPTPAAPNRPLMMTLALAFALGGGAAVAFVLSQIRPTFNAEARLREVTGLPVFGTVTMAWTDAQAAMRRRRLFAFLFSFVSLLSAYAGLVGALMRTAVRI